ncbi:MAG: acetoacetate--CoA ligase [SAR324 cluster bacterium]|nr:acetoacetate--CoA ligase [SAR324 cluster bacterium]MCH2264911.1 acetoacetate--CoA ligase [SAR324 cluster bacterium]
MSKPLWQPSLELKEKTVMTRFSKKIQQRYNLPDIEYATLHQWSIENPELFWEEVWHDCEVRSSATWSKVMSKSGFSKKIGTESSGWFTGAKLNFAENLLAQGKAENEALCFIGEDGKTSSLSYADLRKAVAHCASGMKSLGVCEKDRVAAVIPNCPEAIIGMLAAASLGAIWSSCSPDFGINGIYDRLGQISPKILITANAYNYNGKEHDCLIKIREITKRIASIEAVFVVPFTESPMVLQDKEQGWDALLDLSADSINFAQLPFDHPLYILYSSGTTGLPKSIVHGAGGTLLKHLTEHRYHADLQPGDRLFFFTTCGWMMWNWLVSGLASGATLILYDGAPAFPDMSRMWRLIDDQRITHFGTSPKFLGAVNKAGYSPKENHQLDSLRAILSTGSPLPADLFSWIYAEVASVVLMSVAGGTDIAGCFMGGNPNLPVYSEELQCKSLGMNILAYNPEGKSVVCEKGELVCATPFPSTPIYFWNDSDGKKYHKSYFENFPDVWTHGDFIEITEHGGVIVFGRSDTVLNPGGVRIGTSEIYRPVEQMPEILDSLVLAQPWENDVRIVLFVVLCEGHQLDAELVAKIKSTIRKDTTPRHVPARIFAIPDVPRTISGKKVEKAALQTIKNEKVENTAALANPESLEYFSKLREELNQS